MNKWYKDEKGSKFYYPTEKLIKDLNLIPCENEEHLKNYTEIKDNFLQQALNIRNEFMNSNIVYNNYNYKMDSEVQKFLETTLLMCTPLKKLPDGFTLKEIETNKYIDFTLQDLQKLSFQVFARNTALVKKTQLIQDKIRLMSENDLDNFNIDKLRELFKNS